ncbi:hypothetical protein PR048_008869 [Dryococelus australis]|uniref:Aminopeptidase n=1 Tax=Dryococelus australis TaxID=614101 RepID=A0ABQ9HYC0_9NEOP|nr:hypothetical protein PR048_008869 [Dryococelus australis]
MLLVKEGVSTSSNRQNVATVIAHELAHMWFGNLVSPAWWSYLWLSEGFARYFEFFAMHWVESSWRLDEQFVVRQVQSALVADSSETAHSLTVEVGSPDSIDSIFSSITYNKGGSVIRMMEHFMTSENFRKGLERYLYDHGCTLFETGNQKYVIPTIVCLLEHTTRTVRNGFLVLALAVQLKDDLTKIYTTSFLRKLRQIQPYLGNGTAEPSGLFSSLDEEWLQDSPERPVSVAEVMNTWTLQNGYPLITVTRDYNTGAVTVTQEWFLLQSSESSDDRRWWVPLTYTSQSQIDFSNTSTRQWINSSESEVLIQDLPASSSQWVIFNIQQIGFYRVNYDSRNWDLITQYLHSDVYDTIHLLNRAQLLDDAFNLARAGVIGYPVALKLSRYLSREVDYIPWLSALTAFNFLDRRLQGLSQNDYDYFQSYMLRLLEMVYKRSYLLRLLEKVYQTVGLQENTTDSHPAKLHSNQILSWACKYGDGNCVNMATSHFANLMADPVNYLVPPDLKIIVYCNALRQGGETEFNFLWNRYLTHTVNAERLIILAVMGCTRNETLAHRYLRLLITEDNDIRSQDESSVINSVLGNNYGVDFAINYLNNSLQDIVDFHNSTIEVRGLITSISGVISSQDQLNKLRNILESHEDVLGTSATAALSSVERNLEWLSTQGQTIISWLQEQNYRLPRSVLPDTYIISLVPDLNNFTFDGEVSIMVTAAEVTDLITLHANDLDVDNGSISVVSLTSGSGISVVDVVEESRRHLLVIRLNRSLEVGEQCSLAVSYSGYMRDDMYGFYRSYYYREGQRR